MRELTPDNALEYLRSQGWIGLGPAQIEALGGGVSNVVLRVQTAERAFVLKQSRPRLRTREEWLSDIDRVYREEAVMRVLFPLLPAPTVPEVLFSDHDNYVFAMSAVPVEARVWKHSLLAGDVDVPLGERAGEILGLLHETTARDLSRVESFRDRTVFVQLRVDPFYTRVRERRPEVADAVERIIDRMLATREALCHGDFSPKNILTHARGFTLVDYETAHLGDPAMDLGFFLSHIMLKAARRGVCRIQYLDLTRAFWRGYRRMVSFEPVASLMERAIGHFAVCALARIDGTSPVDYLSDESEREGVRRLARHLLWESPAAWEQVLEIADKEFGALTPEKSS